MDDEQANPTPGITRRKALGIGAAAVAAGSLLRPESAAADLAPPSDYPRAPAGTTLSRTLVRGTPGAGGYRRIVAGAGEPSVVRSDLLGGATRGIGTRTPLV